MGRAFALGVGLNTTFVGLQATFGFLVGSLALLADAGHNLSDVLSLLLAWGAMILTRQTPTFRRTFGLKRSSILAALANAILLLVAVGAIAWEALQRLAAPHPVPGGIVMAVAAVGVVVNTATALLFLRGRKEDINIRGAFLHMTADALVSVGVLVGGALIHFTGWMWIDPALSLVIVAVIAAGTWGLLKQSLNLAMDAVPGHIDLLEVRECLKALPHVKGIHDLHVWSVSTTETAMMVHVVRDVANCDDEFLHDVARAMKTRFGIAHSTVQVEHGGGGAECHLASKCAVD